MSKQNQAPTQPQLTTTKSPESELEQIRAEVASLRGAFVDMALLVMPHHLRNLCACGKLSSCSVQATTPGVFDVKSFVLCDDCRLPEGFREVGRVSLGPAERETVRIANKLGCFSPA